MKALTLRLEDDLAQELEIVAACGGETIADTCRKAIATWITRRTADRDFQAALRRRIDAERRLLDDAAPAPAASGAADDGGGAT